MIVYNAASRRTVEKAALIQVMITVSKVAPLGVEPRRFFQEGAEATEAALLLCRVGLGRILVAKAPEELL